MPPISATPPPPRRPHDLDPSGIDRIEARHHRLVRPARHHGAFDQDRHPIGGAGVVGVVEHGQHPDALGTQPGKQAQQPGLVLEVEVIGRLVEEQIARPRRQRAGQHHPLALAAGEGMEGAIPDAPGFGHLHGPAHRFLIARADPPQQTEVGRSAEGYHLQRRHPPRNRPVLRQVGDLLPPQPGAHPQKGDPVGPHLAPERTHEPRQHVQERGLPRTVGAEQRKPFPTGQRKVKPRKGDPAAVPGDDTLRFKRHGTSGANTGKRAPRAGWSPPPPGAPPAGPRPGPGGQRVP